MVNAIIKEALPHIDVGGEVRKGVHFELEYGRSQA
jgi:hypothetical protein